MFRSPQQQVLTLTLPAPGPVSRNRIWINVTASPMAVDQLPLPPDDRQLKFCLPLPPRDLALDEFDRNQFLRRLLLRLGNRPLHTLDIVFDDEAFFDIDPTLCLSAKRVGLININRLLVTTRLPRALLQRVYRLDYVVHPVASYAPRIETYLETYGSEPLDEYYTIDETRRRNILEALAYTGAELRTYGLPTLVGILRHCPSLVTLVVRVSGPFELHAVLNACTNLQHLTLENSYMPPGIFAITHFPSTLTLLRIRSPFGIEMHVDDLAVMLPHQTHLLLCGTVTNMQVQRYLMCVTLKSRIFFETADYDKPLPLEVLMLKFEMMDVELWEMYERTTEFYADNVMRYFIYSLPIPGYMYVRTNPAHMEADRLEQMLADDTDGEEDEDEDDEDSEDGVVGEVPAAGAANAGAASAGAASAGVAGAGVAGVLVDVLHVNGDPPRPHQLHLIGPPLQDVRSSQAQIRARNSNFQNCRRCGTPTSSTAEFCAQHLGSGMGVVAYMNSLYSKSPLHISNIMPLTAGQRANGYVVDRCRTLSQFNSLILDANNGLRLVWSLAADYRMRFGQGAAEANAEVADAQPNAQPDDVAGIYANVAGAPALALLEQCLRLCWEKDDNDDATTADATAASSAAADALLERIQNEGIFYADECEALARMHPPLPPASRAVSIFNMLLLSPTVDVLGWLCQRYIDNDAFMSRPHPDAALEVFRRILVSLRNVTAPELKSRPLLCERTLIDARAQYKHLRQLLTYAVHHNLHARYPLTFVELERLSAAYCAKSGKRKNDAQLGIEAKNGKCK